MVSANGDHDDQMNPEGLRDAVAEMEKKGDPLFAQHKFKSYGELLRFHREQSQHFDTIWETEFKKLTADALRTDKDLLAQKFAKLEACDDPCAVGLVRCLKIGFRWGGSSFITFLGARGPAAPRIHQEGW